MRVVATSAGTASSGVLRLLREQKIFARLCKGDKNLIKFRGEVEGQTTR
jgi:hypothetical protein